MKNILLLALLLFPIVSFAQNTETRNLLAFNKLEAGGSLDVIIEQGNENIITIESKGIEPEKIITEVKGDVLHVNLEKGNYRNINATVYLTYKSLNGISNSGSGNLRCKSDLSAAEFRFSNSGSGDAIIQGNIKAERLSFDISGSGNVELASLEAEDFNLSMSGSGDFDVTSGSAPTVFIRKSGSGEVRAFGLESDECSVDMSGSGNVDITVNKSLEAKMSGSGDIHYKGEAMVNRRKHSGSGQISKR